MNLFSSILSSFFKGGLSNQDNGKQIGGSSGIATDTGISVNDDRAMQVSAVWACVQYITNSVCSLPINFYKKTSDGRKLLEDHYLNDLFHVSPNSLMKPRDFRKAMTMQLCLWSNAYAEIFWSGERPVAIVPLRPGRMTPFLNDGVLTYHYSMEQGVRIYSQRSILHLKGFGSDGIVGLERTNYARPTLGLSVSADTYASRQFANGGRSGGGYLMFDEFLTDKQRTNARNLYEGMSETAFNKGKLWILEGGVKYETDALNPDTMQMLETRKMQLGEIARFFGVPEVLIGATGSTSAWPASFEQQLLSFLTFTLQDYLDEWETAIHDSLLTPRDKRKVIIDHDTSGFIKMDSQARAQLQSTWVQNGLKTRNEIRKINNDPRVNGADDLTVQVNLTPVDELGVVGAPKEPAAIPEPVRDPKTDKLENEVIHLKNKIDLLNEREEKPQAPPVAPNVNVYIDEKQHITNITVPEQPTIESIPAVNNIQVDVLVPEQKPPTVINKNNIDVKVPEQPAPDVIVNNEIPEPKDCKPKKVTFNRNPRGELTGAEIEDDG